MQADQAGLLGLELVDQLGLGGLNLAYRVLTDGDQFLDRFGALLYVLGRELHRPLGVVAGYRVLDQLRSDVGPHGAGSAPGAVNAEVVGVALAILAPAQAVDQALAALAAEDAALQVVLVLLRALAGDALFVQQRLYAVERVLVGQSLVAAPEGLLVLGAALVDDPPGVVGVAQDALQARRGDLLR
ncbi:MAG TPA: hypothetical protein VFI09_03520 [Solirubrobacterales bacterium]|nr:hypothetical protein [Solirubrobacterales bacterium]